MAFASNIGLNLRVTGHCNQGGRKYMEDAFVVAYQQSEDEKDLEYAYFGIFDGHGGREAALYAKEHLMNNIVCQKAFWSDNDDQVLKAIKDGFLTTHHAMWREVENWPKTVSGLPSTSGTTSSIAFIRRRKLYIGHVGDSKIVVGFHYPGSPEWSACSLTKDHKPETPEEKVRINTAGGLVINKAGVERVVWNRPRPGHKGPVRRSTPVDQIPFLAVARSLGDLWSYNYLHDEFVVSPVPDVRVFTINPQVHHCIIFASDGLWNMMSPYSAVKIVQAAEEENEKLILEGANKSTDTSKQTNNPSKLLVDAALKQWYGLGMRADNTSVVTVMLDPPGPPKCEVIWRKKVMKRLRPRDEQSDDAAGDVKGTGSSDASVSTRKKKSPDSVDANATKERKRVLEPTVEPVSKEKKLSLDSDDPIPRNLPKPVILSPQRVSKPNLPPNSQENKVPQGCGVGPTGTDTSPAAHAFLRTKKKGHDPSKDDRELTEHENENSHRNSNQTEPGSISSCGGVSQNKSELTKGGKDKSCDTTGSKLEPRFSKGNKSEKENGRVHLCEVDNFFKLHSRTSFEKSSDSTGVLPSQKTKSVPTIKTKNFRQSTLNRRSSAFTKAKKLRLHRRNLTSCKGRSPKKIYIHNTRAQSGIRKLKV